MLYQFWSQKYNATRTVSMSTSELQVIMYSQPMDYSNLVLISLHRFRVLRSKGKTSLQSVCAAAAGCGYKPGEKRHDAAVVATWHRVELRPLAMILSENWTLPKVLFCGTFFVFPNPTRVSRNAFLFFSEMTSTWDSGGRVKMARANFGVMVKARLFLS